MKKDKTSDDGMLVMSEENQLSFGIKQSLFNAIYTKTPAKFIKKRKGRGNLTFDFVEGGYIKQELNRIFNGMWSFEVVREQVGKNQIWILGKLTCIILIGIENGKPVTQEVVKMQYGGAEIKKSRETGSVIDIGNDMKAASTDSLKKCASELGIAHDVYWRDAGVNDETAEETIKVSGETGDKTSIKAEILGLASMKQIGMIQGLCTELAIDRDAIKKEHNIESMKFLTKQSASDIIESLLLKKSNKEIEDKINSF